MSRPQADLAGLRGATDDLVLALSAVDDDALTGPSLLPGWTRGHVVSHLARNADALVNVLEGHPMYSSEEARDADIERGAARPADEHRADVRDSGDRLADAFDALDDARWKAKVALRNGVTDHAHTLPLRRWVEVELHHLDLDIGRTVADLSGAFTDRAADYLTARFAGHPDVPPLELRAEDGRVWHTGREGARDIVVGTPPALVGWLSGRTSGSGLTTGGSLPALPPL
ncbi:maleylpyruvate isomerase family mycothiol-dependent enzyme [Streptomyces sp. PT12]|uniref:maleylpyruvate isomerase family mycothiol-dependent enzyme n=1 Tax=Streptomyces sp. PT12 TaxID=1510197 RepID=UPI000DE31F98|nr:maleylpyruvate isomerase family mycothiol-dependent enzyme [Streptomyces sp. PT12]RBM08154.1 mycothiol maleylpyruvate isomerase [Streptomyces sp. PT12]